jgi:hypothetical protein
MTVATRPQERAVPDVARPVARRWVASGRLLLIAGICVALYAAFIPQIIRFLSPLTGDEPFYVMTAISIARDRDLDELNNYQQEDFASFYPSDPLPDDWQGWAFFPRILPPHQADSARAGLYSKHGLGVAVLITPAYSWGGRVAVIALLNVIAALVAANMVLLARRYGHGWFAALALAAPLAFSNPLMSYAYLIFPEIFAALAVIYAFRRSREPENTALQWFGVGLALATLPWLHARFVPAVIGLICLLIPGWWRERSWGRRLAGLLPPALAAVGLFSYYIAIYGRPYPSAEDHAGFNWPHEMVNAAFGLFLDEQWGLLIHAPLYLLAFAGLITLWQRNRTEASALLAVLLPYLAMIAFYRVWWGEWGPPARYLAPIAPLAIAPIAAWARAVRRPVAVGGIALLALPGFAIMAGFLDFPQLMYNHPDGHSALFTSWAARLDREWPKVIPSFQFYSPSPWPTRAIWSLLLVGIVCALALLSHRRPLARPAKGVEDAHTAPPER